MLMHHGDRFVISLCFMSYVLNPFLWFLLLIAEQCISFTGSRSLPILETSPNHVNLRCAILSTNVRSWRRMLHTISFLIL